MPVNVVPPLVSDWPFIDPSVVQATSLVLPSTSIKISRSDKHEHKKKSKSSKKSALPATGLVDVESKIFSDTVIQPVVPGQGSQSTSTSLHTQKLSKHLKTELLPVICFYFRLYHFYYSNFFSTSPHLYRCMGPTRQWTGRI